MKIALIGTGAMGQEVERAATERGWTVSLRINSRTPPPSPGDMQAVDVAIHFARAEAVERHAAEWTSAGKPMVIGTTGWNASLDAVRALADKPRAGIVYGSNFSLGMHIFQHIVRHAASLMNRFDDYDVAIHETHHTRKADSPSGTALTLGKILLERIARKSELLPGSAPGAMKAGQLQVTSARVGSVVGEHTVSFDSQADILELSHRARSRRGFALGALLAADWVRGKTGLHTFDEVMAELLDTQGKDR